MNGADIERQSAWWVGLLVGIIAVVLGVLFLRTPASSLLALTVFLGGVSGPQTMYTAVQ